MTIRRAVEEKCRMESARGGEVWQRCQPGIGNRVIGIDSGQVAATRSSCAARHVANAVCFIRHPGRRPNASLFRGSSRRGFLCPGVGIHVIGPQPGIAAAGIPIDINLVAHLAARAGIVGKRRGGASNGRPGICNWIICRDSRGPITGDAPDHAVIRRQDIIHGNHRVGGNLRPFIDSPGDGFDNRGRVRISICEIFSIQSGMDDPAIFQAGMRLQEYIKGHRGTVGNHQFRRSGEGAGKIRQDIIKINQRIIPGDITHREGMDLLLPSAAFGIERFRLQVDPRWQFANGD